MVKRSPAFLPGGHLPYLANLTGRAWTTVGNLDSARSAEVMALLRRFNRERGQTTIIVTHDPKVRNIADRVVKIQDGALV